jgi:hypothetical protein
MTMSHGCELFERQLVHPIVNEIWLQSFTAAVGHVDGSDHSLSVRNLGAVVDPRLTQAGWRPRAARWSSDVANSRLAAAGRCADRDIGGGKLTSG